MNDLVDEKEKWSEEIVFEIKVLGKLDFRSLHLRNKNYQMNGFQILSEEITINNTVNNQKV